ILQSSCTPRQRLTRRLELLVASLFPSLSNSAHQQFLDVLTAVKQAVNYHFILNPLINDQVPPEPFHEPKPHLRQLRIRRIPWAAEIGKALNELDRLVNGSGETHGSFFLLGVAIELNNTLQIAPKAGQASDNHDRFPLRVFFRLRY